MGCGSDSAERWDGRSRPGSPLLAGSHGERVSVFTINSMIKQNSRCIVGCGLMRRVPKWGGGSGRAFWNGRLKDVTEGVLGWGVLHWGAELCTGEY